jgi:hypothetical protein
MLGNEGRVGRVSGRACPTLFEKNSVSTSRDGPRSYVGVLGAARPLMPS